MYLVFLFPNLHHVLWTGSSIWLFCGSPHRVPDVQRPVHARLQLRRDGYRRRGDNQQEERHQWVHTSGCGGKTLAQLTVGDWPSVFNHFFLTHTVLLNQLSQLITIDFKICILQLLENLMFPCSILKYNPLKERRQKRVFNTVHLMN